MAEKLTLADTGRGVGDWETGDNVRRQRPLTSGCINDGTRQQAALAIEAQTKTTSLGSNCLDLCPPSFPPGQETRFNLLTFACPVLVICLTFPTGHTYRRREAGKRRRHFRSRPHDQPELTADCGRIELRLFPPGNTRPPYRDVRVALNKHPQPYLSQATRLDQRPLNHSL